MFEQFVERVRSWMDRGPTTEIVKTPRVLTKDEHGIDPALVSWQARKT